MTSTPRLTIELVPTSCWYSNVRSNVSTDTWDRLQSLCFVGAEFRCQICHGVGPRHPVELHEIWYYDDRRHVQRLDGLVVLCPDCHRVKHIGRAMQHGALIAALKHLAYVNQTTPELAAHQVRTALAVCHERSKVTWRLDISLLTKRFGIRLNERGQEIGTVIR